jgi:proteasome accessory factor B
VSAKKTERLLNLVICLLATRRYLSVQEIRTAVPGYDQDTEESFRRMFERDKEELRELGIPLETGTNSHAHDDEPGYRIARRDYELPDIHLEPDEAAALGLAARLWQSAPAGRRHRQRPAQAAGRGVGGRDGAGGARAAGRGERAGVRRVLGRRARRRALRFAYRGIGRSAPEAREVEPWGVVSWRGAGTSSASTPRATRSGCSGCRAIVGAVQAVGEPGSVQAPDDVDLRASWRACPATSRARTARVRLRHGAGWELRREATRTPRADGWDVVEVGYSDPERFADRVTGYGSDAVVLAPPEARDAVLRRLEALAR